MFTFNVEALLAAYMLLADTSAAAGVLGKLAVMDLCNISETAWSAHELLTVWIFDHPGLMCVRSGSSAEFQRQKQAFAKIRPPPLPPPHSHLPQSSLAGTPRPQK